jgi:hypothetical protein
MGFGILFIRENPIVNINRRLRLIFTLFAIVIAGCSSRTPEVLSYPNPDVPIFSPATKASSFPSPVVPTVSPVSTFNLSTPFSTLPWSSPTATYDPGDTPPELLFTATPDPYVLTIRAELEPSLSREEITRLLFSKWMDHFLSESMSLEWRLSDYTIDSVFIPADQKCADKLGALFMAEAVVTAKTVLPAHSTTSNSSDWMRSAGGYTAESETQRTIRFISAIKQRNDEYILEVIMQAPTCDPS